MGEYLWKPEEASSPLHLELQSVVSLWERDSGSLEKPQVFLTTEASFSPSPIFTYQYCTADIELLFIILYPKIVPFTT